VSESWAIPLLVGSMYNSFRFKLLYYVLFEKVGLQTNR
jgi:hypothetical protein